MPSICSGLNTSEIERRFSSYISDTSDRLRVFATPRFSSVPQGVLGVLEGVSCLVTAAGVFSASNMLLLEVALRRLATTMGWAFLKMLLLEVVELCLLFGFSVSCVSVANISLDDFWGRLQSICLGDSKLPKQIESLPPGAAWTRMLARSVNNQTRNKIQQLQGNK